MTEQVMEVTVRWELIRIVRRTDILESEADSAWISALFDSDEEDETEFHGFHSLWITDGFQNRSNVQCSVTGGARINCKSQPQPKDISVKCGENTCGYRLSQKPVGMYMHDKDDMDQWKFIYCCK